jgi:hypothetical protein
MQAKIAIAFGVILALWIGFMTYRHFQKGTDDKVYIEKTFSQMTDAAKKIPKAGLAYMGMAIKNYQREKNKYPAKLIDLWPDYIQDKSFIEAVDWKYTPAEKNFRLSKTVDFKTAYIDNNLSPRSEKKAVQVASRESAHSTTATGASASGKVPSDGKKAIDGTRYARLEPSKEREYNKAELKKMREKLIQDLLSGNLSRTDYQMATLEKPELAGPVYTVEGAAGKLPVDTDKKYLAWKSADGALGFGNIMYPDLERNLAYRNGQWFRAKYPEAQLSDDGSDDVEPLGEQSLTQKYGKTYLAWKNPNGALGFGNVMYPKSRRHLIYQDGRWTNVRLTDEGQYVETAASDILDTTPETLARKHGGAFLTWKRTDGTIGFGNVMYPETSTYNVYAHGQWLDTSQNPLQETTAGQTASSSGKPQTENTGHADLVEKYSNSLYLWENPSGALGFGNVNYPDKNAVPVSPATTDYNTIGGRYDTE